MNRFALWNNWGWLVALGAAASLVACLDDSDSPAVLHENSRALCQDGRDNDGDGHWDCYDRDCFLLDSSARAAGQAEICSYEDYRQWNQRPSSSLSSSSQIASSSSSSSGIASSSSISLNSLSGFPVRLADSAGLFGLRIVAMRFQAKTADIVVTGQFGTNAFTTTFDTNGVRKGISLETLMAPSALSNANLGPAQGRTVYGIDTNLAGAFVYYGEGVYAQGSRSLYTYALDARTQQNVTLDTSGHISSIRYMGTLGSSAQCLAFQVRDTAFALVRNAASSMMPSERPLRMANSTAISGSLDGGKCTGLVARSVGDSSQIWFYRLRLDNYLDMPAPVQLHLGSLSEKPIDLWTSASGVTYVAAQVDGNPRLLIVSGDQITYSANQGLLGSSHRLIPVRIQGTTSLLLLGSRQGKGAWWLFSLAGTLQSSGSEESVEALDNALQLPNGSVLLAGRYTQNNGQMASLVIRKNF